MLGGGFERVYTDGDNSPCIPTDTMKNTIYALAKQRDFDSPESFAALITGHFIDGFAHVAWAEAAVEQDLWQRISVGGAAHPHAFTRAGSGARTASVRRERSGPVRVSGGLCGLEVIKTTGSGFSGFLKDRFTTLAETDDRILATKVDASWTYSSLGAARAGTYDEAREAILEVFATHDSRSVQQTLYAMAEAVLARLPEITSISLSLPNQHRILANLGPFGMSNANEVFIITSEPFGVITATVTRAE
jgi:urate oxidase